MGGTRSGRHWNQHHASEPSTRASGCATRAYRPTSPRVDRQAARRRVGRLPGFTSTSACQVTGLGATLLKTVTELKRLDVDCALIGGLAVSVRTEPRFTRAIDLAVAVRSDSEAERLVNSPARVGFHVDALVEQEAVHRLATVRLRPSTKDSVVDLLFVSSGIESEIVAAADPLEVLPNLAVPVARTGHLIALKLRARDDEQRPQDRGRSPRFAQRCRRDRA